MSYNFEEQLNKDEKSYGIGGGSNFFEINPGNNNVCRILTPGVVRAQHFFGKGIKPKTCYGYENGCPVREVEFKYDHAKPSIQYVLYVLDRADNQIKIANFGYSIMKQIASLQKNPDYAFEDLPMPYDIRITKTGVEQATEYKIDVKPKSDDLTPEQLEDLNEKLLSNSPESIVEKAKTKQRMADVENGTWVSEAALKREQDSRMTEFKQNVVISTPEPVVKYVKEIRAEDIFPD